MINGVILKALNKHEDARGWLCEIFRHDEVDYMPAMSYVSVTKPGVARGPHEHKYQSDCFVFTGPGEFDLYLWDRRGESPTSGEHTITRVGESAPMMVIVPPGVVHGYKCVSENDAWCINLPDRLYKGIQKQDEVDEIRWEEAGDERFKI
jgi:dTDP-4-dehydrorhamnose 3,5-epimerase